MLEEALLLLKVFLYILPAGVATMLPPIVAKLTNVLSTPLDFGKTIGGKPIFGANKTFRGLLVGCLGGISTIILEIYSLTRLKAQHLYFLPLSLSLKIISLGFLLGFGAIAGDAIKSFLKRRLDIKPGQSWFPFDQVDWIIGAVVFTYPIFALSLDAIVILIIMGIALHLLSKLVGYWLGINSSWI